ncbi:MAG: type 1 glutamine amidotransferase domain-containing protein, partial [Ilumatobacteraceae bacterium]|nr:type 1 glutamine amidotransferase domain-containing protein [Ilumatobacteraceae bacterium]
FWWGELTHPYWEFTQAGYEVTIASPLGGALVGDAYSDPEDEFSYAADDFVSLGFKHSPSHRALVEDTPKLSDLDLDGFDAVLFVGGQAPMYTFRGNSEIEATVRTMFESGKPTALMCHATSTLLDARDSAGRLLVEGKKWTGFTNAEEDYVDAAVGQKLQPFRIEDEARRIETSTFVTGPMFAPFVVQDGNLITGQQQNSGAAAARTIIAALEN